MDRILHAKKERFEAGDPRSPPGDTGRHEKRLQAPGSERAIPLRPPERRGLELGLNRVALFFTISPFGAGPETHRPGLLGAQLERYGGRAGERPCVIGGPFGGGHQQQRTRLPLTAKNWSRNCRSVRQGE